MAQKHTRPRPHAEFRHRSQVPCQQWKKWNNA